MIDSHSELILLIDAVGRLHGRLRSAFAGAGDATGLSAMEQTVLAAVVEAQHPPTVAQIGRSLGHPRQVIQRAAHALAGAGLIALRDNPDHKRASLLVATAKGAATQHEASRRAEALARDLLRSVRVDEVREANRLLNTIRATLEQHGRQLRI